jgi:hypothetical protein
MGPCGLPAMLPAGAARQTPTSARSPAWRSRTSETCSRGTHRTKPGDRPVPSREQALAGRTPGSRRGPRVVNRTVGDMITGGAPDRVGARARMWWDMELTAPGRQVHGRLVDDQDFDSPDHYRRPCSHTARHKIAITPCSPPRTTNPR